MTPNPLEDFEKALRLAVANVKDKETFHVARELIFKAQPDNINAVGSKFNKTALNYALEFTLKYVLDTKQIDMVVVRFKLSILDSLLCRDASLAALEHADTKELLQKLNSKCEIILNVMKQNGYRLSEEQKKLLGIRYCIKEQQELARKIQELEAECRGRMPPQRIKALIVCEAHNDLGSSKFLTYLKEDLIKADYINLCLEYCDDLSKPMYNGEPEQATSSKPDKNYLPLSKFASQPEFRSAITIIDLLTVFPSHDILNILQQELCMGIVLPSCMYELRDLGMTLKSAAAMMQKQGNFVFVVGAMHGPKIINFIKKIADGTVVVAPFEDPYNLQLKQVGIGKYVPAEGNTYSELYSTLGCQPINMNDALTDKLLHDFATKHFQPTAKEPVELHDEDKFANSGMRLS